MKRQPSFFHKAPKVPSSSEYTQTTILQLLKERRTAHGILSKSTEETQDQSKHEKQKPCSIFLEDLSKGEKKLIDDIPDFTLE